ncbi:MAG: hypothetical protein GX589_08715 [Deltaproteobacteria bacterium]|jgi:hypothetical protein|nr:hypothetical protein [Deltaproteobacteria bacterium]
MRDFTLDLLQRFTGNERGAIEGSLGQVVLLAILAVAAFGVCVLILSLLFGKKKKEASLKASVQADRLSGVLGRLEKMEKTLNEFKTETLRAQEFTSLEFKYLRGVLEEIKRSVERGPSGPGQAGSPDSGPVIGGGPGEENWDFMGDAGASTDTLQGGMDLSRPEDPVYEESDQESLAGRLEGSRRGFFLS